MMSSSSVAAQKILKMAIFRLDLIIKPGCTRLQCLFAQKARTSSCLLMMCDKKNRPCCHTKCTPYPKPTGGEYGPSTQGSLETITDIGIWPASH